MPDFQSRTIILSDPSHPERPRHMAYSEWGAPDNPDVVLCLHGLSRNGRDFDMLAGALAPRYRVLCPDMAGRGKSNWLNNTQDYSYATYLADINALFERLSLGPVTWVGTSMGGILGMMMAAAKPERIRALVLNDVGATVSAAGLKRILGYVGASSTFPDKDAAMEHLRAVMKPFGLKTPGQWQHMFAISFTALPGGSWAFAYDPAISQPLKEAAGKENPLEALQDIDLSMFWDAVQCPALLLRGAESDILSASTAQAMCRRAISTRLMEIDGVGHAPALLDDDQVGAVAEWIRSVA